MNSDQKDKIKATVPILRSSGELLTDYFYKRMFLHNPELKGMFNMANQANGKQKSALANAVLAYAENIDAPSVLISVLKGIGNKHVSLHIEPEHYQIVGYHLLESIKEVLGDFATTEVIEAWEIAFFQLADIMISIEKEMYDVNEAKPGAWKGWREFEIKAIAEESDEIKSFYLYPKDGKEIGNFHPGQFISIQVFVEELNLLQPRQYSLSSAFNPEFYRISVKKEAGINDNPSGLVSNTLHKMNIGDTVNLSTPMGLFHLQENANAPLVLISAGIGLTPMFSILETNRERKGMETVWIHGCRKESVHAFKDEVKTLNQDLDWLKTFVFYEDLTGVENTDQIFEGRVDLEVCKEAILKDNAHYYICGPEMFIKAQYQSLLALNIDRNNIFYEEFGPQLINLN